MSFFDQIRIKTEKLLLGASPKERMFYEFITGGHPERIELGNTLTDDLCRDAFVERAKQSIPLNVLQKAQPLKNIHYTNNLIDLTAASIIDITNEQKNIEAYINMHTLRESYLISIALGTELVTRTKVEKDIDRLIELIEIQKIVDGVPELLTSTLSGVIDIFDVIVLKKIYTTYLKIHPDGNKVRQYDELLTLSRDIFTVLDKIIIFMISSLVIWGVGKYIIWYLANKEFHDELQEMIVHISSAIILALVFLGFNIPKWSRILSIARFHLLRVIYKLFGLDYLKICSVLKAKKFDKE